MVNSLPLNSWNEWSPLREVVVGSARGYTHHYADLSFEIFYYDNLRKDNHGYYPRLDGNREAGRHTIQRRFVEELIEDVEGIAETFAQLGVTVRRPLDLAPERTGISTLAWSSNALPPLNIRDNTLIIGDTIIETPPMLRSRYFESQMLSDSFLHYQSLGAAWYVMPRPLMTDASFDHSYVDSHYGIVESASTAASPYDVGVEAMFDGAQCVRLGKDVIVNVATENHAIAVDWLEAHFRDRIRFHRVHRLVDSHLDSTLLPLKPGVFLVRDAGIRYQLPRAFRNWRFIVAPPPTAAQFPSYSDLDVLLTSEFIDINVLSVDEERVLVNAACPQLMKTLESEGFTPVPVVLRHRRVFGGGLHCFTLDTVRDGALESYVD